MPVQDPSNLGLDEHEKRLQIKFDMVLQVLVGVIFLLILYLVLVSHSIENQFYLPSNKILMLEGVVKVLLTFG